MGHILATAQSATRLFEMEFDEWATNLRRIFGHQSINSFSYRFEEAFNYGPPLFVLPKPAGPKIDLKRPYQPTPPMPNDIRWVRGGPPVFSPPPVVQRPPPCHMPQPQPLPLAHLAPPPIIDRRGGVVNLPISGKLSAAVPLFHWTSIGGQTNLPDLLKAWRAAALPGTERTTPKISGRWLCFKFCMEGLSCQPSPGRTCPFTHVDLAQPSPWNSTALHLLAAFLSQEGIPALGITLTPAGTWATGRTNP